MSWSLPGDCERCAKTLETKSTILGKALNFNSASATDPGRASGPSREAASAGRRAAWRCSAFGNGRRRPNPPCAPLALSCARRPPRRLRRKPRPKPSRRTKKRCSPIGNNEIIVDPVNLIPSAGCSGPAAKRGRRRADLQKAD
ncbi:hypothetical protein ACRAWD_28655 [Caulobacter segnis]